jgi:hypothetical protein
VQALHPLVAVAPAEPLVEYFELGPDDLDHG